MIYRKAIEKDFKRNKKNFEIARKIYLSYPTHIFKHNKDQEFDIKDSISKFFNIPFRNIHIIGSAKTGESFIKEKKFEYQESDLDVAIIDLSTFFNYLELVFKVTKGYKDFTKFSSPDEHQIYEKYLAKGIFRPDLMPLCSEKRNIRSFFNDLSNKYIDKFKNITASIYASECFFESKQGQAIKNLRIKNVKI